MRDIFKKYYNSLGETPPCLDAPLEEMLSDNEYVVFKYYGQGLAIKEISWRLEVTDFAVKNTLERIKTKLGVRRKTEFVLLYLQALDEGSRVNDTENEDCGN